MTTESGDQSKTIVEIGGEGGSIRLQGRRGAAGAWQFRLGTNEAALYDMLGEEPPPPKEVPWVSSWDEALALLDRYPWPLLYPLQVHAEFKEAVFAAIEAHERGGPGQVERWRDTLDE